MVDSTQEESDMALRRDSLSSFDALRAVDQLTDAGYTLSMAKAVVTMMQMAISDGAVTRGHIKDLKDNFGKLENTLKSEFNGLELRVSDKLTNRMIAGVSFIGFLLVMFKIF